MTDIRVATAVVEHVEPYTIKAVVFNVLPEHHGLFATGYTFFIRPIDLSLGVSFCTKLRVTWTLEPEFQQASFEATLDCRRSESRDFGGQILTTLGRLVGPNHAITVHLESISRLGGNFVLQHMPHRASAPAGAGAIEPTPTLDDLAASLDDACDLHDRWVARHGNIAGSPYLELIARIVDQIEPMLQEEPCVTP